MVSLDRRFCCQLVYSCCSFTILSLAVAIALICFNINSQYLGFEIEIQGAQVIGIDWEKPSFVGGSTIVSDVAPCPPEYPDEMVYDIWQGLQDTCYCQTGSSLPQTYREGGCTGKAANSPYCISKDAVSPVLRTRFNGKKICGNRSGSNFLTAVRPRGSSTTSYSCPNGYLPCGGQEVFDQGKQENVICVGNFADCPITGIDLSVNEEGELVQTPTQVPDGLPLAEFKFSTGTPCIDYTQQPVTSLGQVEDEYTFSTQCEDDTFLGMSVDSDYKLVPGDFSVLQGNLETSNGISDILSSRFNRNDVLKYEAITARKDNVLKLYQRSVTGWKLECESDPDVSNHFTRQEAYDMMFKKTLNTQSDTLRDTMFYGPLFVSVLAGIMLLMAVVIAIKSFCRKKDCLVVLTSCSTNNGTFGCASTFLTAFLFFYLLLFYEALNETNSDIEFVNDSLAKVNACLGPNDQINVDAIRQNMKLDQQRVYETVLIMLIFYLVGYCFCILPSSFCLFTMRK